MENKVYCCIDLKSFFASVEAVDRGLDPFTTNLVVADSSRGKGSICLAITPAMKALGIKNRCRIFEIPEHVEYISAMPRMKRYMEVSSQIYGIYLKFISPDDIHVYSIDECFIDITSYISLYGKTPKEIANMLMNEVMEETGICATAGIGTNMFLAKVALDITAKKAPDHIGYLDEELFKNEIWNHKPITDIWNIGKGIASRLAKYGVYDLKGVTGMSEQTLYREFGVNAEYLIEQNAIDVEVSNSEIRVMFGNIALSSKLVEGKFPDYNRVIPMNNNNVFKVKRELLSAALKRTAILANAKLRGVKWDLKGNTLMIQSTNSDQEEAQDVLDIEYNGIDIEIGFNLLYLQDVLNNLNVFIR